ncbi:MAG: 1-phosphofructokinase [Chloroflexi bacterium]|nr:1-phosphofructokinase [Chloroflexota bacterium]MBL7061769.1 1-phosphofructokinase [Dehalococcoidia bacterium]
MIATVTLNPSLDKIATVEELVVDEANRWTSLRRDPGGKGINVSRVVHELGGETIAYGFIGGIDGETLKHLLQQQGVPFDFTPIQGEIRSNFIITDLKTRRQTRIDAPGPRISRDELRKLIDKITRIKPKPDFMVFAGSVPPGVPTDIYRQLIEKAKKSGIKTVLDSDNKWLKEGINAKPNVIKPNVHEAEELLETHLRDQAAIVEAVKTLVNRSIDVAAISRGKDGLIVANGEKILKITPPQAEVRSTIGAGDSTIAGLVLKLSQGHGIEEASRWAVASGTAAVLTPGTELCRREDVERLLPQVKVERL